MNRNGLLMVMMQPPSVMEEEFNAWYDTEHVPERRALPGFQSGLRFVCIDGYPRYMALYDLDREDVLHSPEYLAISVDRFSPWTRRMTSHMPVYRIAATQIYPGPDATLPTSRLVVMKLAKTDAEPASIIDGLHGIFGNEPVARQIRLFVAQEPTGARYFGMVGLSAPPAKPIDFSRGGSAVQTLQMVNTYVPYDPSA